MSSRFMQRWRKGALAAVLLLGAVTPGTLAAQQQPYTLEDLQLWISSGVRTPRILQRVRGICFNVDLTPGVQDQLRRMGSSQELITGLIQQCPPRDRIAVNPPSPQPPVKPDRPPVSKPDLPPGPTESRYSRRALYPLYYDRPTVMTLYGGVMKPVWTGTDESTHQIDLGDGDAVRVRMPEAPVSLPTYGVSIGPASGLRLDLEMYLHQSDFPMVLVGPAFEPFLPLGRTRFRLILGANGWLMAAGQHMPVVDELGGETSDTLTVTSFGAGGDGRAGLAYHPRPGMWIFAEARYRWVDTFYRYTDVSSTQRVEDFPWPKLGLRGPSVRIGIGF